MAIVLVPDYLLLCNLHYHLSQYKGRQNDILLHLTWSHFKKLLHQFLPCDPGFPQQLF